MKHKYVSIFLSMLFIPSNTVGRIVTLRQNILVFLWFCTELIQFLESDFIFQLLFFIYKTEII